MTNLPMQDPQAQAAGAYWMASSNLAIGVILLSQTVAGVWGNSSLLYNYLLLYFKGNKLKYLDLILMHLIVSNFFSLLCKGVPQTMAAFGLRCFLDDFACKLLSYFHRVGRGVSFGSTCSLSVFQAITISPEESGWARFKAKAPKYIGCSIYLNWILSLLLGILSLKHLKGKLCSENTTRLKDLGYCSAIRFDRTGEVLHVAYVTVPGAVCMVLMLWSGSSMVLVLHRHKNRRQHMNRTNVSAGSSHESRATKTILFLMSTFLCFYTLSMLLSICLNFLLNPSWFLVSTHAISSACFPTLSPFLLMRHGSGASSFGFTWINCRNSP